LKAPKRFSTALVLCATALILGEAPARAVPDDAYLAGYATAMIERDLGLVVVSLEVRDRVAYVVVQSLGDHPAERITAALTEIEGIERVEVSEARSGEVAPAPAEPPAGDEVPVENGKAPDPFELLPRVELFDPLIADPRDPHFSVIYQWYLDDPELNHVGSANFGETFALFGGDLWGGRWEIGGLGGVFSIFDLDASSFDLVNSDFRAGLTFSARNDGLSAQLKLYHQSSHLGDEFLLNNQVNRINLSYEGVDLLISGDPWPWLRLYGGGGVLVNSYPGDLHRLSVQAGVELQSPVAFFEKTVRPLAAFNYAAREENHWHEELSGSAGIQLENPKLSKMRVQVLANYFKGNSPNGQFFVRRIESLGVGVHLHF
jgi:hypothetical protein